MNEEAWVLEDKRVHGRLETESTEARAASGDRRVVLPSLQRHNRGCQSRSDYCFLPLVSSAVFCVRLILSRAPVRVRTFFPVQAGRRKNSIYLSLNVIKFDIDRLECMG